jgi:hypothetical protein
MHKGKEALYLEANLDALMEAQGWNDLSIRMLISEFIVDEQLSDRFLDYLEKKAAEEKNDA